MIRKWEQLPFRIAVLAIALLVAWPTLGASASAVLATRVPDTVLAIWPASAAAKVQKASVALETSAGANAAAPKALAISALLREPVNAQAARLAGVASAMEGQRAQERSFMLYAHTLTRRDFVTELWMIENASQNGTLDETLGHYDHALRTRSSSWAVLLPVLVEATRNPLILARVETLAQSRPPYWTALADNMIELSSEPRSLAAVIGELALDATREDERERVNRTINKLIAQGSPTLAYSLYSRASGTPADRREPIRDGGFETGANLAGFDWQLHDEPDLGAIRETRDGSDGMALSLIATSGRGGDVARQLLMLAPGSYRLSFKAGDVSAASTDRPRIAMSCSEGAAREQRFDFPQAPAAGRTVSTTLTVPRDCEAQWLSISVTSGLEPGAGAPWIDQIAIARVGG